MLRYGDESGGKTYPSAPQSPPPPPAPLVLSKAVDSEGKDTGAIGIPGQVVQPTRTGQLTGAPAATGGIHHPPPAPTQPPRATQVQPATGVAAINWIWVSALDNYPGNFPNINDMRTLGINGVMILATDPLREQGAAIGRANGFRVGVWADPHNFQTVESFIGTLQAAQQATNADAITLDVELIAKGPPGSDAYRLSQTIADAAARTFQVPWAVTPVRSGAGDFDFKAYTNAGGTVIVQTYGADPMVDLFDPVEVVQLALQAGVPPNKISVLISPKQIGPDLARLKALGVTNVSIWRTEGLTPGVIANAAPFLTPGDLPETLPLTGDDSPVIDAPLVMDAPQDPELAATADWGIDESVYIEESDLPGRALESAGGHTGAFAHCCWPLSVSGYVKGENGPVGTGLRQLELIFGTQHVHDDFAMSGHAACSYHYCGLAVDLDAERIFFDVLYPIRSHLLELLCPWGLWDRGVKFDNEKLLNEHSGAHAHIHVALNLTPAEVRTLLNVKPGTGVPAAGGTVARAAPNPTHYDPTDVMDNWRGLLNVFRVHVPNEREKVRAVADSIRKVHT